MCECSLLYAWMFTLIFLGKRKISWSNWEIYGETYQTNNQQRASGHYATNKETLRNKATKLKVFLFLLLLRRFIMIDDDFYKKQIIYVNCIFVAIIRRARTILMISETIFNSSGKTSFLLQIERETIRPAISYVGSIRANF